MPDNYDNDDYDLPSTPLRGLTLPGYKTSYEGFSQEDLECGYKDLEDELDLNDMFGAFKVLNYGLVGGDRTVDDFTPEGLEDRANGREISEKTNQRISGATTGSRYP